MAPYELMMIDCDLHGEQVGAVICMHMREGQVSPAGFIQNGDDADDPRYFKSPCCFT